MPINRESFVEKLIIVRLLLCLEKTRATIDQLQNLVSTDSRFKNMRDAINRSDPPSIPYVGMYLTDLSFIEEGTPNFPTNTPGMLNFSKMRMIAHVIREIQQLQNGSYKIELNQRVSNYLLDNSRHMQEEEMYHCSLLIEPRIVANSSKQGAANIALASAAAASPANNATTGASVATTASSHSGLTSGAATSKSQQVLQQAKESATSASASIKSTSGASNGKGASQSPVAFQRMSVN